MTIAPLCAFSFILGQGPPLFVAAFLISYLIGSISFAYIAGKIKGIDLREHGSKNIGASNALGVLGKSWGICVFFCDFMKGFLPLFIVKTVRDIHIEDADFLKCRFCFL